MIIDTIICDSSNSLDDFEVIEVKNKDIQIILRLFLVKPVQASFFQPLNLYRCLLAGKEA